VTRDAETLRRQRSERDRTIRLTRHANAAAALGPIVPGMDVYCLTFGQFDLSDALAHILAATGPADVVLATWTAAKADITKAERLLENQSIRSIRWIVDQSFPNRQPAFYEALRAGFGSDSVTITRSHAKFGLVTNDRFSLVLRTSMNLNTNRRLENLELVDDPELCAFLLKVADSIENEGDSKQPPILAAVPEYSAATDVRVGTVVRVG
jgi:hypothetical protein